MSTIVYDYPPNKEAIMVAFPNADSMKAIYSYAGKIYNPHKIKLYIENEAHEYVHEHQQRELARLSQCTLEEAAIIWWKSYINSVEFRLAQEIPAYRAEWLALCFQHKEDKAYAQRALYHVAEKLASPLYGNMCNVHKAYRRIKNYA